MTWVSILAVLDGDDCDRSVVESALAVAEPLGAVVEGLIVRPDPRDAVRLAVDGMSPAMIESVVDAARAESERRIHAAREAFNTICAAHRIDVVDSADVAEAGDRARATWHQDVAIAADRIALHGRLADLAVVGRPAEKGADETDVAVETVLFETACPLLAVGAKPLSTLDGAAVLAWNGGRESAAALSKAMPLLQRASSVTVLQVGELGAAAPTADAVCAALARRDVRAEARTLEAGGAVATQILEAAAGEKASLLVMGAYGHSRLRELVLGGVTRRVLLDAELPVLMAH